MGGLFGGGGKTVKAPPVPEPPPVPIASDEAEDFAVKEQQKKSGASKTFLTGNLTPKYTGKKRSL